jgi:uncharacterized membrane protein YdjX (TVP38/TMEM64 family)
MNKKTVNFSVKDIIITFLTIIVALIGTIFGISFILTSNIDIIVKNDRLFQVFFIIIMSTITILYVVFRLIKKQFLYKALTIFLILVSFCSVLIFILQKTVFFDKIKSIEEFRNFIASFGGLSEIIFILIQFLQVCILPIPGIITVGAGVLLFGPLKGALLSIIGILLGSIFAFFIGKVFGYKVACWLVGKDELNNWLKKIKGKDKIILAFMFLFPFFPDDILCVVAGLTTITWRFFILIIIITRTISIFTTAYSLNGSIIPYNTWWGILIWFFIFTICILTTIFVYKKGEKIQKFLKKRKN